MEKYTDILEKVCKEHITTDMNSGIITLFNYKIEQEELVKKKIEELYENIKKYADQFEGFSVVIGVGRKMNNFSESSLCLKTAVDAIKYRIKVADTGIIYLENYQFDSYDIDKVVIEKDKQNYLSKIISGDIRGAQECVASKVRKIKFSYENYSPLLLFDVLIMYAELLSDYCKQHLYNPEYEKSFKKWNVRVDNTKRERKLLSVTEDLIKEILEYMDEEKKQERG